MNGFDTYYAMIAEGIPVTLSVTASCFLIGGLAAMPIAAARLSSIPFLQTFASSYIAIVRGIPPITWLFVIFYGLPQLGLKFSSFSAALVGLSMVCSAYIAEIYRAGWLGLPSGQVEAAKAIGLSPFEAFRNVIAPQLFVIALPMLITFFIALLKNSAVVAVIGVSDIAGEALSVSRTAPDPFTVFLTAGLVYMSISVPVGLLGRVTAPFVARRFGIA